ncbi:MAG: hypothetical protein Q8L48_14405 [Archangium sp.]|nr:hypothetical protein [Archangium sp.]
MLDAIQEQLEAIYGIRAEYRAKDFLVDSDAARRLGGSGRSREELLLSEDGQEVALYIEPSLLARVSSADPKGAMTADMGDFCEVAEGVSHFLYVVHTVKQERTVSLLELEAQAEVDKFAVCTLLEWGLNVGRWAGSLVGRLFEQVQLRPNLTEPERWRYTEANRLAKSYCERLLPMVRSGRMDRLLAELRHGYRLGAEAKLAYFGRAR